MIDPGPMTHWLLSDGRAIPDARGVFDAFIPQLRAAGMPLWRCTLHLPQLHPQVLVHLLEWREDWNEISEQRFGRSVGSTLMYHHSPVALMHRTGRTVRRRLAGPEADLDFPVLEELADQGGTDYALIPIDVGSSRPAGISLASRAPEGLTAEHVQLVEDIAPALGAVCQVHVERETARGLLDTYVGQEAGRRILEGQMVLGSSRSLEAVVLFCDMRGFTALSERLGRDHILRVLNEFFDAVVTAVHRRGGEVLKFMGDGLLAIFPLAADEPRDEACARSIMAALEGEAALAQRSAARRARGEPEFHAYFALHIGTVAYGNIGADGRQDFTVIGPAVNRAARIQSLAAQLDHAILTSQDFAAASPVQLLPIGRHALRGLAEEQEIFAPALEGQAAA